MRDSFKAHRVFQTRLCSLLSVWLWFLNSSCSRPASNDNGLCRIRESVFQPLAASRTDVGEIVVYNDWTYVEHYTNIWRGWGMASLVVTGHVDLAIATLLSNSLSSRDGWVKVRRLPTYTLAIDDRLLDDW